jgi:hypothetical protein
MSNCSENGCSRKKVYRSGRTEYNDHFLLVLASKDKNNFELAIIKTHHFDYTTSAIVVLVTS